MVAGGGGEVIINYHTLLYTFMKTQHTVPFWIFYGNRLSYTFMMTHQTGAFWNFYGRRGWERGGGWKGVIDYHTFL